MSDDTRPLAALEALSQWVNWDAETKRPSPKITGTLLDFHTALERSTLVGFVFTAEDPYAGIDIDSMTPLAAECLRLARAAGAWVQRSPSGKGWHIIGRGALPRGIGKGSVDDGVEAYSHGRYFTVPDNDGDGDPDVCIQHILDLLWAMRLQGGESSGRDIEWTDDAQAALEAIPADDYHEWVSVGMALRAAGAPFALWDGWSATSEKYAGRERTLAKWDSFRGSGITLGTVFVLARQHGWSETAASVEADFEVLPDPGLRNRDSVDPEGYWARLAVPHERMVEAPPPREWAWDQWVPYGVVTGLAGPPGVAKSTLALQLAMHHVLGDSYLGLDVGKGPAVFITVEDDEHELRRRVARIAAAQFLDPDDYRGLTLIPAVNAKVELVDVDPKSGQMKAHERLRDLRRYLRGLGARLIVLDLVGDFWDGNENARAEVAGYVRAYLGRLAVQLGAAVLAVTHTNKAGGVMGSQAWLGSFRSCLHLDRYEQRLGLTRIKANYAPPMDEPAMLEWREGYLTEVPLDQLADEHEAELERRRELTPEDEWLGVDALRRAWGCGRNDARRDAERMVEMGWLEHRRHAGDQWRVC